MFDYGDKFVFDINYIGIIVMLMFLKGVKDEDNLIICVVKLLVV